MQTAGKRFDDAANKNVLGGYTLWNLSAQKQLSRDWSLVARVNNLADSAMNWLALTPPKAAAAISA